MNLPDLDLDYVAPRRGRRAAGLFLLAVGVVALVLVLERIRDLRVEGERVRSASELLPKTRPTLKTDVSVETMRSADAVMRQLSLPWAAILQAAEAAALPEVALLQVEPDARERRIRLAGEAKDVSSLLEYLRRLGSAGELSEVHLASHQVANDDPRRPVQFSAWARLP